MRIINNLKYKIRCFIVKTVHITAFEWSQIPPEKGEALFVNIRNEFEVNDRKKYGLELRFGKLGCDYFVEFPRKRQCIDLEAQKTVYSNYFHDDQIKQEFYPYLKEIQPRRLEINTTKNYRKDKKIMKFIRWTRRHLKGTRIDVVSHKELGMFS